MVVDLIRAVEAQEAIPWRPTAFDLLLAARKELVRSQQHTPKSPLNPDKVDLAPENAPPDREAEKFDFKEEAFPDIAQEVLSNLREKAETDGHEAGYKAGYDVGLEEGKAEGHKMGYYAGYEEGVAKGQEEGTQKGFEAGKEQGHAEGFEAGRAKGHEAGYEEGMREGSEEALSQSRRMAQLFKQFNENLAKADQELAEDMLALSVQIADQILTTALQVQPELLLPVIKQAMQTLPQASQPARILVNPMDLGMVENYFQEQGMSAHCTVIGDESVEQGGCRIETESALVDATLANRRERVLGSIGIYREWLEKRAR